VWEREPDVAVTAMV
jgi:hypothetical protein